MSDFGLSSELDVFEVQSEASAGTVRVDGKPVETQTSPPKFVKEIDLGDGSGVQKFEADTEAELIDKLVEAQTNATKEIRKLQRAKPRARPQKRERVVEPDRPFDKPSVSSQEDLDFATQLAINPSIVFGRLFEASTGIKLADLRATKEKVGEIASALEEEAAGRDFVNTTPEYLGSAKNSKVLMGILEDEELPVTQQNLSYAYQQAMDSALLELPAKPEPKPQAQGTVTKVKRTQTALSAADTGQQPVPAAEEAGALPDVNKLLEGDLESSRERIVREMQRLRNPAT